MNRTPMSQSYLNRQAGQEQQQQQQQQQPGGSSTPANSQASPANAPGSGGGGGGGGGNTSTGGTQVGGEQMPQLMCATELTNLLLEFAFSVFVNKPQNILEYAASYFNERLQVQRTSPNTAQQQQQQESYHISGGSGSKRASSDSQRSNISQNSFSNEHQHNINNNNNNNSNNSNAQNSDYQDDEFDCDQPLNSRMVNFNSNQIGGQPVKLSFNRRKSVFAEQYDPANDQEDDENNRVVHSKTDEQRSRLARAIKSIFIFRSVDGADMTNILDAMFEVKVSAGDVVIRQGDDGDNFYVVERGKFRIIVTRDDGSEEIRGEYENDGSFGELALMYNQPRAATVVALTDGSLWAMDRNTFRRIVLKSAFKKRKEYEALFEKVDVLKCLNGYERMNLCDALESKRFASNQMIINQGDQANGMYFIESGEVKIVKQLEDGKVMEVATLRKGEYFGELALINHKPRAASVFAVGDEVKLAFLDLKAFERLLGSCIERMEKNSLNYLTNNLAGGRQNV